MAADLVAFVRARIDEDEQAARAATPGPWRWDGDRFEGEPTPEGANEWGDQGPDLVTVAGTPRRDEAGSWFEPEAIVISAFGYDTSAVLVKRADAEHIARHDPARVLREVEAKRRIIGEHRVLWEPGWTPEGEDDEEFLVCARCEDRSRHDAMRWPCPTLRLLALPFAEHPDYQKEWAPDA